MLIEISQTCKNVIGTIISVGLIVVPSLELIFKSDPSKRLYRWAIITFGIIVGFITFFHLIDPEKEKQSTVYLPVTKYSTVYVKDTIKVINSNYSESPEIHSINSNTYNPIITTYKTGMPPAFCLSISTSNNCTAYKSVEVSQQEY